MGRGFYLGLTSLVESENFTEMKRVLSILALLVALLPVCRAQTNPPVSVSLHWSYPTNLLSADLVFQPYVSTNAAVPLTNWTAMPPAYVTNLVVTNLDATGTNALLSYPFNLVPGQYFFYVTPSNFWSTAAPSNISATPPVLPAIAIQNVTIRRGS